MVKFLQPSVRNTKTFLMGVFTTNHETRVADGIGGKAKSLVQVNVMSKGNDRINVQSKMIFKSSKEATKQNTSGSFYTGRNVLKNIKSY